MMIIKKCFTFHLSQIEIRLKGNFIKLHLRDYGSIFLVYNFKVKSSSLGGYKVILHYFKINKINQS